MSLPQFLICKNHHPSIKSIPFAYEQDGCDEKSDLSYQLLLFKQVPKSDLKIAKIIRKSASNSKEKDLVDNWSYHATNVLTISNGEKYILDPTIDSTQALTFQNWIEKLGSNFSYKYQEYPPNILENSFKGRVIRLIACPRFSHLYRDQYLALLTNETMIRNVFKEVLHIKKQ